MKRKMINSIGHVRSSVIRKYFGGDIIKHRIYIMENGCTAEGKFLYAVLKELDQQGEKNKN